MLTEEQKRDLKCYVDALKPTLMGRLVYTFFPFKKKTVLRNMLLAFEEALDDDERKKLAICFYGHMLTMLKECFFNCFMNQGQILKKVEFIGDHYFQNALKNEKCGALILIGHFGNWELAPLAIGIRYNKLSIEKKKKICFLTKSLPKFVEKITYRNCFRSGLEVIHKAKALEKIRCHLKKKSLIFVAMDQHACLNVKDGIPIDFFGKKAGTYKSFALFACFSNATVFSARTYHRKSDGKHVIEFFPPISRIVHEDREQEIALNTRVYNEILEKFVLDYPEQWNWFHRRWREDIYAAKSHDSLHSKGSF